MKVTAELYGARVGVNGSLRELIENKEVQVLLTFQPDDFKNQYKCILNHEEATNLMEQLYKTMNDPTLLENGYKFV